MKIAVIGGGASALMFAGKIAPHHEVVVFEKNNMLGKKLLITGNGRCNVTNTKLPSAFLEKVLVGNKFLSSALNGFSPKNMCDYLTGSGVALVEEDDNKMYPQTGKSRRILDFFTSHFSAGVNVLLNANVISIEKKKDSFLVRYEKTLNKNVVNFSYSKNETKNGTVAAGDARNESGDGGCEETSNFDAVVIATGGCTYTATGSTGEGYEFAKALGHSVSPLRQSLCGLLVENATINSCPGISHYCGLKITDVTGKVLSWEEGDIMLTNVGVSGPAVHRLTAKYLEQKITNKTLCIDFLPNVSLQKIEDDLVAFSQVNAKSLVGSYLDKFLAKRLADSLKKCNSQLCGNTFSSLSREKRKVLIGLLKNFEVQISDFESFEKSIVTRGGINTDAINPKTMESKIMPNLFFLGEVMNVDALTGGYSLQIAFSTAVAAANYLNLF